MDLVAFCSTFLIGLEGAGGMTLSAMISHPASSKFSSLYIIIEARKTTDGLLGDSFG